MNSHIIHAPAWTLSDSEREAAARLNPQPAPNAADVIRDLGLTLVVPLSLALFVNFCLWAAGVPVP
jgi:hypothetical protein